MGDDVGDVRLNLPPPRPPQGPRQSGARKPQPGVGCDQPRVGCQCRPLLRLTLVKIQAALFVSFLARTGKQNAKSLRVRSSPQSTAQDVYALQSQLNRGRRSSASCQVTQPKCRYHRLLSCRTC